MILCALALGAQSYIQAQNLKTEIVRQRESNMQTLTTEWTSGGIKRSLTTTRNDGESDEEFIKRHHDAEARAFAIWPKDE